MRVVHFINNIDLSWYRMFVDTVRAQEARGHTALIVVPPGGSNYRRLRADGLPALPLPVYSSKFDYAAAWRLSRILRRERADVLHTHLTSSALLGAAAARRARIPCVASVLKLTKKRRYMRCDFLIPCSDAVREDLLSQGVPAEKMRRVYTGMDIDRFLAECEPADTARAEFGFGPEHFVIGSVARLAPMKGHRFLLDAAAEVVKKHPNARFLIVGDGPLRPELEERAASLGISVVVVFAGARLDLQRILNSIDIAVLASVGKEGLPMILVESALMRRPLVMTDVAGIREMLTDGETGWLAPPENPERLAAALCDAIENPREAARRAAAAEARIRSAFDVRETVRQIEEVYTMLTSADRRN